MSSNWAYLFVRDPTQVSPSLSLKKKTGPISETFCFLVIYNWSPLWPSAQSFWLQIQRSGFYSWRYQIFWEVWVWNGVHSASWVQLRSYLEGKVTAPVYKTEITAVGIRHAAHVAPSIRKSITNFADKRRSLGRYSSLADSIHGVQFSLAI
jgi:hypothetical protein